MLRNNYRSSKQARTGKGEKLKLDTFPDTTGRPTGQGYGAARKGPSVTGKQSDVVVEEDYSQGKSFKVSIGE